MDPIPLISRGYEGRSRNFDHSRIINWYPEMTQDGKSAAALLPVPGLKSWNTLGGGPVRGLFSFNNQIITVSGSEVYEGTTKIGTMSSSAGPVRGAHNGSTLVLVDGVAAKEWDGTTFSGNADIGAATHIVFLDNYLVFNVPDSGKFRHTELASTTVDLEDTATAEGSPDNLVAIEADDRQLWLFGESSTEVWQNFGDPDQVFRRIQGSFMEFGCAAPHSTAVGDRAVFWLDRSERGQGRVMAARGYQPQIISTRPIEHQIRSLGTISDAVGWVEQHEGHLFYVLNFPVSDATWVYDISNQAWHERSRYNGGKVGRARPNAHVFHQGSHYVGDFDTGEVYTQSPDEYDDDGDTVIRERYFHYQHANRERFFTDKFEIEFETGEAGANQSEPQAMLRWSDDNGRTWSNEYWRGLGDTGDYAKRAVWYRTGVSRSRIFHVKISDTVQHSLVGAYADIEVGIG